MIAPGMRVRLADGKLLYVIRKAGPMWDMPNDQLWDGCRLIFPSGGACGPHIGFLESDIIGFG